MTFKSLTINAVLMFVVLGATWLSSKVDRTPSDEPGAISIALVAQFEEYSTSSKLKNPPQDQVGRLPLCLAVEQPVDVMAVARRLAGTQIRVIPAGNCTSKTIEGNFGMFTELTTWYDQSGDGAVYLIIDQVICPGVRRCIVDVDGHGSGMRYEVVRVGRHWSVTKFDLRWIV